MENKNYVVVGGGVSGMGIIDHLKTQQANIFLIDKRNISCEGVTTLKKLSNKYSGYTAIVSPGISLHNKIYKQIKRYGLKSTSELELFGTQLEGTQIAVTGTNGKTTTTMLIESILKESGKEAFSIGNIGTSIAKMVEIDSEDKFYVVEASSFMLEKIDKYKPNVALFLNFAPDHLNFHKNLKEYFNAKMQVFKNMNKNDLAILNYNDKNIKFVAEKLNCAYLYFSTTNVLENGAYIKDNCFYFSGELVCKLESSNLIGKHNLENILAAICVAKHFSVENSQIETALKNFKSAPHRLQKIVSPKGLVFYNSSKATNVASAITDINSVDDNKIVLFGGSDKGENFKKLFEQQLNNVKIIICYGKTCNKIFKSAIKFKNSNLKGVSILKATNLNEAINIAAKIAKMQNLAIMLAPACASFDEFNNYEERGNFYLNNVNKF